MLTHGTREYNLLQILTFRHQILYGILMCNAHHILFDDRAGIQFRSDIMTRSTDNLHPTFKSRMLSGFVVGYAYDDRWGKLKIKEFIKRRAIRLHPMVVMGAIIGAVMTPAKNIPAYYSKKGFRDYSVKVNNAFLKTHQVNWNLSKPDIVMSGGDCHTEENGLIVFGSEHYNYVEHDILNHCLWLGYHNIPK